MTYPPETDKNTTDEALHSDFYKSIVACMRALSNDEKLTVSIGTTENAKQGDVHLPLISDQKNTSLVALIRGLSDSYAMMRLYHDVALHHRIAPHDAAADRLFTMLERERFEELGGRKYPGVARNLQQLWTLSHTRETLGRFNGAEQLEFALCCLCREQVSSRRVPLFIDQYLKTVRQPIDELLGGKIKQMWRHTESQRDYAACAMGIIKALGFDTSPKSTNVADTTGEAVEQGSDSSDPQGDSKKNQSESDQNSDEKSNDKQSEEDLSASTRSDIINEEAASENETHQVRNNAHGIEIEPEILTEEKIVETQATQSDLCEDYVTAAASYKVFDNVEDDITVASKLADAEKLRRLRKSLDQHIRHYEASIGQMASRLQKLLLSQQQRFWESDRDEGELDPQRLARIVVDPLSSLTYRVQAESAVRDTAVCLLIDNSRSMFGKPIITAASCADLITRILERSGVATEVLGYTTVTMYGGAVAEKWQSLGSPDDVGRLNNIRHIIYKSASASWLRSKDNFGLMLDKDLLKQNIDGEALLWAQKRLLQRSESRRILMVISDGKPSDSTTLKANHKDILKDHLDYVIKGIERRAVIELVAIGIGHEVSDHYRHSVYLDDVEQLGPLMLSELSRMFKG